MPRHFNKILKKELKITKMNFVALIILMLLVTLILFFTLLQKPEQEEKEEKEITEKTWCSTDSDCICGGIDMQTGKCFIGNTDYYNKYVDKSRECPDFCAGIAGNLKTACINNSCKKRAL